MHTHTLSYLMIFMVYSLACLGLGGLVMQLVQRIGGRTVNEGPKVDISTKIASAFLVGVALYSVILTVLGLLGQLHVLPLIMVLLPGVGGLVFGSKYLYEIRKAIDQSFSIWKKQSLLICVIAGITTILAVGLGFGSWILPPKGDAAAFYLVYPKIMAASGVLEPMPGPLYYFSMIGLSVELHYTALMILADVHAAKFFMFPIAMAACVLLASLVRLCGGGVNAVTISWAMVLSSYTFNHYIFDGKVDLIAAAFGLAAVYWFLVGSTTNVSFARLAASGWFAGLATSAKFSYIPVLGTSLLVLFIWRFLISRISETSLNNIIILFFKMGSLMTLAAIIAWGPQLLKNGMLFDSPLAPFIAIKEAGNWLNQVWFSEEVTRKILYTYPLALVFGRYPMQGGGLSFLFLAFLPLLMWLARPVRWRGSMTVWVTVSALVAVLMWMLLRPSVLAPRYILASLLLFVPVLALATEAAIQDRATSGFLRMGILGVVLLAIASSFWHLLPLSSITLAGLRGHQTECMVASQECSALQKLNSVAQPGDRIFLSTYYTYWLDSTHLQCRNTLQEARAVPDRDMLLSWFQARGFSYAVVDPNVDKNLASSLKGLAKSVKEVRQILDKPALVFHFVFEGDMPGQSRCVETAPGRWHLEKTLS